MDGGGGKPPAASSEGKPTEPQAVFHLSVEEHRQDPTGGDTPLVQGIVEEDRHHLLLHGIPTPCVQEQEEWQGHQLQQRRLVQIAWHHQEPLSLC